MQRERRIVGGLLLGTALLYLPVLRLGFIADLYWLPTLEPGLSADVAPYYVKFGDPVAKAWWQAHGFGTWWSSDAFQWTLLRPLSVLALKLQARVFGLAAGGYHLVSLLSYLGLIGVAWRLFRRMLPGSLGLIALALFATHFSHLQTVWWYSNQHSLFSVAAALLGFLGHLRWREEGWRPGALLSMLGLAVGLAAGETALCTLGLWLSYELFSGRPRRFAPLLPVSALTILYLALHQALGYTSRGSLNYLDPGDGLLAFAQGAIGRLPALFAGAFNVFPADFWLMLPQLRPIQTAAAAVLVVWGALMLRAAWAGLSALEQRSVTWLGLGSLVSLLPVAASPPGGRLLLVASLGSCAVIGVLLRHGARMLRQRQGRLYLAALLPCALLNGLVLPLLIPGQLLGLLRVMDTQTQDGARTAEIDDQKVESQDLIVLTMPGPNFAMNFPTSRHILLGSPYPASWWVLSAAPYDVRVLRTAPDALELDVIGGHLLGDGEQRLFRPSTWPLHVGDTIDQGTMRAQILAVDEVGPTRVDFQFKHALDDPRIRVLAWMDGALRNVTLPAVGADMVIPHAPWGW